SVNHSRQHRIQALQQLAILRVRKTLAYGLKVPKPRIDGVVFRLATCVWKVIGQHPAVNVSRKCQKDLSRHIRAPGSKRQSRKRDHGVAAPISKPVVARNDAASIRLLRQTPLYIKL